MTDTQQPSGAFVPPLVVLVAPEDPRVDRFATHLRALTSPPGRQPAQLAAFDVRLDALARSMSPSSAAQLATLWRDDAADTPATLAALDGTGELDSCWREGARVLRHVRHDASPVVWRGAHHAWLLPLWRRALGDAEIVALFVPVELAELARRVEQGRSGLSVLARGEAWNRAALSSLTSLPTFVTPVPRELDALDEMSLAKFLSSCGIAADAEHAASLPTETYVAPDHGRTEEGPRTPPGILLAPSLDLEAALRALRGAQASLQADPGTPSQWMTSLLEQEQDLDQLVLALDWTTRQLEPILRTEPVAPPADIRVPTARDEAERTPEDGGPYPLNASQDRAAYHRWLEAHRLPPVVGGPGAVPTRRARTRPPEPPVAPLISVLVPVFRPPLWALERCVGSVLDQDFARFELILCDDASGDGELERYLAGLPALDARIRVARLEVNSGISAATNAALAQARGSFVAFLDHDDELAPQALGRFAAAIDATPDADLLYSDEDKLDAGGERFDPLFKPEFSPDLLTSFAYVAHLCVIRTELVRELGGLRSAFDGSQDWDLTIRASERARRVVHIPEVLYHWRVLESSAASGSAAKPWAYEAGRRVLEDTLARRGEAGEVLQSSRFPGRYHLRRAIAGRPKVCVIIPFRDEPSLLATCATSMREAPGYDHVELVLVDNDSQLPETAELLDRLAGEPDIRVIEVPGRFNWAAINNAAARACDGDLLLFSNNDIEARVPGWLHALAGQAQRREVGAVGARLLYPDGTIQHAGVVVGLGGIAGHVLRSLPADDPGYNSMAIQTRNCSVVTGACMMVRREVFDEIGGFDEALPVAFNDVDFCLKLREAGYLVVYEPLAELVHHESKSRGHTDDLVEGELVVRRWAQAIVDGDPYLNANLSHWRYWCPLSTAQEEFRWKTYLETSVSTPGSWSNT